MNVINTTLVLLLLLVILVSVFIPYINRQREGFVGEANDFGGAPQTVDVDALAQCVKRIKDLQDKKAKDATARQDAAAMNAMRKKQQDEERINGYKEQLDVISTTTKDAIKKKDEAMQKIISTTEQEQKCSKELAKKQSELDIAGSCCDEQKALKDKYINDKQSQLDRATKLIDSNNALDANIIALEEAYNQLIANNQKCQESFESATNELNQLKKMNTFGNT